VPDRRPRCVRCAGPSHEPASQAAYAYLLGLYLGDGHVSRSFSWTLTISCDQSYPEIIREARTAITAVVPGKYTSVTRREGTGLMRIRAYDRAWPCLLPQHGPGRKHARPIILADWQAEIVREHPGRLLRGLIHSDGWRGLNRVRVKGRDYAYPRYQFSNRSDDIRRVVTDTCDLMGIAWRPWGRWHISVARRDAVALLDEHVGPKSRSTAGQTRSSSATAASTSESTTPQDSASFSWRTTAKGWRVVWRLNVGGMLAMAETAGRLFGGRRRLTAVASGVG